MHLMCLNTRVHCVSAIGYDGFVFCNLAITSLAIIIQHLTQTNLHCKGKKIKLAHHSSEFLNYLWNPDFIVWGSETVRHVLYGKIQKRKSYNDCSPSKPNRTKKRQDDVLSFQKITGSYYHFIAYLSLLNDRPNSFYHLNFNFFEF